MVLVGAVGAARVVPVGEGEGRGFASVLFDLDRVRFSGRFHVKAAFVEFAFGSEFDRGLSFEGRGGSLCDLPLEAMILAASRRRVR